MEVKFIMEKRIAEIAESIHQSGRRVVLITGPSSSGKTSFARRLCIQLRVIGMHPLYLGTDDFFLNRDQTPMDEHGERNFENLEALDINLFSNTMNELLKGKKTDIPVFDFLKGEKAFGARIMSVEPGQPIIIEGIHALNPELTTAIGDEQKFRIYISPLTQLNIDDHNRIPTTDGRMLRRIVRDYQFRGASAADTINRWPSVKYAENRNIYPYSGKADMFFNSFCIYELPVLKHYAEPQLKKITPEQKEFPEAQRLLEFTAMFTAIDDDFMIPKNSILREFIGGSILL
ncbi:MAG: nucleoside kinase [Erysipelotrichia bacterium]|nr:nucleoside kinase [Erysipelotrichia bacterium]